MPNFVFRFPGGRYHATPWGNHVNEGLVEWPPSPWRIVRALVATGFSKLNWREPPAAMRDLVDALATVLPEYRLPPATAAHTRHWMPVDSPDPDKRSKVLDAFARIPRGGSLSVLWPAALSLDAASLLEELVPKLSYLGRAESVVEARLVDDGTVGEGLVAVADETNRPGVESIGLLMPMTMAAYAEWRARNAPVETGKGAATNRKAKESPYPEDAFAATLVDTSFLQRHGWTRPPGTRRVMYARPLEALSTSPARIASPPKGVRPADTALLALASDTRNGEVLPLLARGLPQCELLHMALVSGVGDLSCPELSGHDAKGERLVGHRHASFTPLDLDDDGRLDHVLVHAPMGFGAEAQAALRMVRRTYTKGAARPLFVTLAGLGGLADFRRLAGRPVAELGESRFWTTRTPFVPPRHIKAKRHTVEDQVRAELASRGLPKAMRVEVWSRDEVVERGFQHFIRARRDVRRQPPAQSFFGVRIELEEMVRGPIALGYASHFGLGVFEPAAVPQGVALPSSTSSPWSSSMSTTR